MGLMDKFKNLLFPDRVEDDYDEYGDYDSAYETETVEPQKAANDVFQPSKADTSYQSRPSRRGMTVVIMKPQDYEASEKIASHLREMRPVVLNFEETDSHDAARIVDFVSGATYSLDGDVLQIGKSIFLCTPANVQIEETDKDLEDIHDNFSHSWSEKSY